MNEKSDYFINGFGITEYTFKEKIIRAFNLYYMLKELKTESQKKMIIYYRYRMNGLSRVISYRNNFFKKQKDMTL
jgi:hypothetical protein